MVVVLAYSLAPDYNFTTGRTDCADSDKERAAHAVEYGVDPAVGYIVGGHSLGGSTAVITSLQVDNLGLSVDTTVLHLGTGNLVNGQVPDEHKDQYRLRTDERSMNTPILDAPAKKLFKDACAYTDQPGRSGVCGSVVSDTFQRLRRTYFQVCGMDVLRDEALVYEHTSIHRANGVDTLLASILVLLMFSGSLSSLKRSRKQRRGGARHTGRLVSHGCWSASEQQIVCVRITTEFKIISLHVNSARSAPVVSVNTLYSLPET